MRCSYIPKFSMMYMLLPWILKPERPSFKSQLAIVLYASDNTCNLIHKMWVGMFKLSVCMESMNVSYIKHSDKQIYRSKNIKKRKWNQLIVY